MIKKIDADAVEFRILKLGKTKKEIVEKVGAGGDLFTRIKQGRNLNLKTIFKVAEALDCEPESILVKE